MPLDSYDTDVRMYEMDSPTDDCGAAEAFSRAITPGVSNNLWLVAFLALVFASVPFVRAYVRLF